MNMKFVDCSTSHSVGMGRDSGRLSHGMCHPFLNPTSRPNRSIKELFCSHDIVRILKYYIRSSTGDHCTDSIQMGYDFGVSLPGGFHGVQANDFIPSMVYSNVDCDGTEDSIWDCSMNVETGTTGPGDCCTYCYERSVAVYCSRFC